MMKNGCLQSAAVQGDPAVKLIRDLKEIKNEIKQVKKTGKTVGLVPTMGFLHEGHLSLLQKAREETDYVVMSIFVNPIQFGRGEDYQDYPRDLEGDREKAEEGGCDLIFYPEVKDMYPPGYHTFVNLEEITEVLCGACRPGHFRGVATVVTKLFNLITPDKAYFGQKDAQQSLVVKKMAEDLNMDVEVVICPTVREEDGVAMSSRNKYLEPEERVAAQVIYRTLCQARQKIEAGEKDAVKLRRFMWENLRGEPLADPEYAEVLDARTLQRVEKIGGTVLLALAARFGQARLIDNFMVEV